jgi:hypothetical protein
MKEENLMLRTQKRLGFKKIKEMRPQRFAKADKSDLVKRLKEIAEKRKQA